MTVPKGNAEYAIETKKLRSAGGAHFPIIAATEGTVTPCGGYIREGVSLLEHQTAQIT